MVRNHRNYRRNTRVRAQECQRKYRRRKRRLRSKGSKGEKFLQNASCLMLRLLSPIGHLMGVLRKTPCPTVTTATRVTAAVISAATAVTTVPIIVANDVAVAVMRVRDHLVSDVLSARAQQFLQADDRGDHQRYFADQQSFASDGSDRTESQGQKGCSLQGQGHQQWAENLLGLLCNFCLINWIKYCYYYIIVIVQVSIQIEFFRTFRAFFRENFLFSEK